MSLEERHWPSLCIVALLLALSAVAVVEVCAYAMPVINAVLNNAIAIYFDFMVSSIVNRNNTGYPAWFHRLERACPMRLDNDFKADRFGPAASAAYRAVSYTH